jgi:hypothetical protein
MKPSLCRIRQIWCNPDRLLECGFLKIIIFELGIDIINFIAKQKSARKFSLFAILWHIILHRF